MKLELNMMKGQTVGLSDEWYTPPDIFDCLGVTFDLDPCSPGKNHWVPANNVYTKEDDGLLMPWVGTVFMNPPYGGRNSHVKWLEKFILHGDGIAVVRAYTSSGWWHDHVPFCDALLFPKGKTKFVAPNGVIGNSPSHGVVFLSMGDKANKALMNSNLGQFLWINQNDKNT